MDEVKKMFKIKKNIEKQRWEFEPKSYYIGYLVSFSECKERNDAIAAVYHNIKNSKNGKN